MMSIDWSKAPEGATHYDPSSDHPECWVRRASSGWDHACEEFTWHTWWPVDTSHFIPRPTKPAAPEWDGEGYPPVGCECDFCDYSENEANRFKRCLFLGLHDGDAVWLYLIDANEYHTETNVNSGQFRPFRTKEQRQRDDLLEILYMDEPLEVRADAILSKYNLEPKK